MTNMFITIEYYEQFIYTVHIIHTSANSHYSQANDSKISLNSNITDHIITSYTNFIRALTVNFIVHNIKHMQ